MKLVGIVNLTPDSFSDGGVVNLNNFNSTCLNLLNSGAAILDFGAESTRPNATPLSACDELHRFNFFLPAIRKIDCLRSIDTYHPETAELALQNNFHFINCVHSSALPDMFTLADKFNVHIIATFDLPFISFSDISCFFKSCLYNYNKTICDFGIGFNKSQPQNKLILENLHSLESVKKYSEYLTVAIHSSKLMRWDISRYSLAAPVA